MGAESFYAIAYGKNAGAAFNVAVEDAQYNYGHSGYTGSIAEKDSYKMLSKEVFESEDAAQQFAYHLIEDGDGRIDDKWGPAGCVSFKYKDGVAYLFFGWASS